MKTILRLGFIIILFCIFAIPIQAQSSDRVYDRGSVWEIAYVQTKPGHFDDYLKDLSNVWKVMLDELKKDGKIISYKVLSINSTRDNEPDLILMVEQKNWAVFDTPDEYYDGVINKVLGSQDKAKQANIKREDLRTLRGSQYAVELLFKK